MGPTIFLSEFQTLAITSVESQLLCQLPQPTTPFNVSLKGIVYCIWYNGFRGVKISPFTGLKAWPISGNVLCNTDIMLQTHMTQRC